MAKLTAPRDTSEIAGGATSIVLPVKAATTIFQGSIVVIDADGYAIPGKKAASLKAAGRAEETVENAGKDGVSAPGRFCSFSPNRKCRKMAGKGVQPLDNYTCRFCLSSLKQADKSGLDRLQAGKLAGV